jgi:uncharacterized membrane protein YfcA
MIKFLKIWSIAIVMMLAAAIGYFYGAFTFIQENDFTYLSFANLVILTLFTILTLVQTSMKNFKTSDSQWFLADAVLSLGMVGTLAGFLAVLYSTFQGLDVSDTESMKQAIETLATGMGTALLTSLVGLVASLIMKLQLVLIEEGVE